MRTCIGIHCGVAEQCYDGEAFGVTRMFTHDQTLKMSYRIRYIDRRGQGWTRFVEEGGWLSLELSELKRQGLVVVSVEAA